MDQLIAEITKKVQEQLTKEGGILPDEHVHDMIKSTIGLLKSQSDLTQSTLAKS